MARGAARLRAALHETLPAKSASNLLVGTWNVLAFGDLTMKWASAAQDSPKRDFHAMACIAEIVSRFDVLAPHKPGRHQSSLRLWPAAWRETSRRRPRFLSYFESAPSNQDLSTGAGAAPACLATIFPSTMIINVGTA